MTVIAIAQKYNTFEESNKEVAASFPEDRLRVDATRIFIPFAKRFLEIHKSDLSNLFLFNNLDRSVRRKSSTRVERKHLRNNKKEIIKFISEKSKESNITVFAYFGHGSKKRLSSNSGGLKKRDIPNLAEALGDKKIIILLYACWVGAKGGFAEILSKEMPNAVVFAHSTRGHAITNPYVYAYKKGIGKRIIMVNELFHGVNIWEEWIKRIRETKKNTLWAEYYNRVTVNPLDSSRLKNHVLSYNMNYNNEADRSCDRHFRRQTTLWRIYDRTTSTPKGTKTKII